MSDPTNKSPYANIDMDEYTKRMKENREKYPPQKTGIRGGIKKLFLWWLNIGASFMGLDKKNILADADPTVPAQNPYAKDPSAGAAFRASQRVEPHKPTHEEMVRREIEYQDIKKMTDGQGDHVCNCK